MTSLRERIRPYLLEQRRRRLAIMKEVHLQAAREARLLAEEMEEKERRHTEEAAKLREVLALLDRIEGKGMGLPSQEEGEAS